MRIIIFFILIAHTLFAQYDDRLLLNIHIRHGQSEIGAGDIFYPIHQNDSFRLEQVKFYLAGIELWRDNKMVWVEPNSFHLIDVTHPESMKINLSHFNSIKFNKLKFIIGIDSATNTAGAMGGDLDPTKGMYWTWQSGYINFKVEGTSNRCNTRNNKFKFHIGGYRYPYTTAQNILLPVEFNSDIHLVLNIDQLLERIFAEGEFEIMSPCFEAVRISQQIATLFTIIKP